MLWPSARSLATVGRLLIGIADAGADMMPHSATPATRLIATAFTGTSIWLLLRTQDKCHSCVGGPFRDRVVRAAASDLFYEWCVSQLCRGGGQSVSSVSRAWSLSAAARHRRA